MEAGIESRELRRIDSGPAPGEIAEGLLVHVAGRTSDPPGTLSRVRDVLRVILTNTSGTSATDLATMLPAWFVIASAPEPTRDDAQAALSRWRADRAGNEDEPWSVVSFLYWFEPEMRSWWWWDAQVVGKDRLGVTLVVEGHPFADGALRWLFRAAGAEVVGANA